MRRYETVFILRPNVGEEEVDRVIAYVSEIITAEQGTMIELNKWGMKKLAYLIKKESLGYYVYADYAGTPAAVAEIERKFRIDDSVLKYMTIKTADQLDEEAIANAIAQVSAAAAALEAADGEEKEAESASAKPSEATAE